MRIKLTTLAVALGLSALFVRDRVLQPVRLLPEERGDSRVGWSSYCFWLPLLQTHSPSPSQDETVELSELLLKARIARLSCGA
jgi:hypothetical protein